MRGHRAKNADGHFQTVGHEDGDALALYSYFLEAPRETRNRAFVLGERQPAVFTDQGRPIGRSSGNILQGVQDRGVVRGVCRDR
jgi:hypothetical protein